MLKSASVRLKNRSEEIMKDWELRANDEVLGALQLESLALRDSLPELLTQIVDALSTTIDRTSIRVQWDRAESLRVGRKHGRERAVDLNYTMDQMIFEYHILRQVICDVMEKEAPLLDVEREVIVSAIEQAVNDAATQFSDTLRGLQEKLASALTHDMRGPITAAKINAQMILRRLEDTEHCTQSAKRIVTGMDRLDSMIHTLLDASLIRAGQKMPLKFEEFDLKELAECIMDDFNAIYENRFRLEAKSPAVGLWSRDGLHRVIENLATNAVKYGKTDTLITLTLQATAAEVILSVHNEGTPISEADQKLLFQQFTRIKSATDTQTGWGLGLTVVKSLAEAHRGQVRVESAEGKGTTFTITLPRQLR